MFVRSVAAGSLSVLLRALLVEGLDGMNECRDFLLAWLGFLASLVWGFMEFLTVLTVLAADFDSRATCDARVTSDAWATSDARVTILMRGCLLSGDCGLLCCYRYGAELQR